MSTCRSEPASRYCASASSSNISLMSDLHLTRASICLVLPGQQYQQRISMAWSLQGRLMEAAQHWCSIEDIRQSLRVYLAPVLLVRVLGEANQILCIRINLMKFRALGFAVPEVQLKREAQQLPAYQELEKEALAKRRVYSQDEFLMQLRAGGKEADRRGVFETVMVKPIQTSDIKSLTERAFFRVFNPKRSILSDQQIQKSEDRVAPEEPVRKEERQPTEECICKGAGHGSTWIECDRSNCKGSAWYHMVCVGIEQETDMKDKIWVCPVCLKAEGEAS